MLPAPGWWTLVALPSICSRWGVGGLQTWRGRKLLRMDEQLHWGCVRWLVTEILQFDDHITYIQLLPMIFKVFLSIIFGESTPSFKKAFLYLWTSFMVTMRGWYVLNRIRFLCLLSHITNLLSLLSKILCLNMLKIIWFTLFQVVQWSLQSFLQHHSKTKNKHNCDNTNQI